MGEVVIHSLIPEGMYRELVQNTNLHGLMRNLFSPIENVDQFNQLIVQAERVREVLISFQQPMIKELSNSVLRNLPLFFVKDRSSRIGSSYLRWRNISDNTSGEKAWGNIINNAQQPQIIKQSLVQAEKERILLNMQMSIIVHIIRQLTECNEKLKKVEEMAQSHFRNSL